MRQYLVNAALSAALGVSLLSIAGTASAKVKRGDPGASCTTENRTINGQAATCEICSATKCDTDGTTVSNCRKETTTTCTIDGRVVNPGPKGTRVQPLPKRQMQMSQ